MHRCAMGCVLADNKIKKHSKSLDYVRVAPRSP